MMNLRHLLIDWLRTKRNNYGFWAVSLESHYDGKDIGSIMCHPTKAPAPIHPLVIYPDYIRNIDVYANIAKTSDMDMVLQASDPEFLNKLWRELERLRGRYCHMYMDGKDFIHQGYKPLYFSYPSPDIEIRGDIK